MGAKLDEVQHTIHMKINFASLNHASNFNIQSSLWENLLYVIKRDINVQNQGLKTPLKHSTY